jgi:crotonobetainyl-CoA:carnitine CoA-transferase CaiB-like acyl-CoA transferase
VLLADMGADVIKVERAPTGDDVRNSGPFVGPGKKVSAPYVMMNRNKRGVALNLRHAKGKEALRRLVNGADIFVENFRTGAMEHYGIDYPSTLKLNPRLIYCSLSGFGQTGPYASRGGFDLVAQAESGLMSFTGEGPGRPPVKVGSPVTDILCGTLGTVGILGAVNARHSTGKGQFVDSSLFEAGVMMTFWQTAKYLAAGEVPQAMGSAHPMFAPYQAIRTSDSFVIVAAANQATWERLCDAVGASDTLKVDPRFLQNFDRVSNLDVLIKELVS